MIHRAKGFVGVSHVKLWSIPSICIAFFGGGSTAPFLPGLVVDNASGTNGANGTGTSSLAITFCELL